MVKIRNYGVGTGYTSNGITGAKSTFDFDEKVYACHVWDDLFNGAAFRIYFERKVAGVWKPETDFAWINSDFASAYQYAWIKGYPSGEWRAKFTCSIYGPYYSYFTINPSEIPTPPTPPPEPEPGEFPKSVTRAPYSFTVNNAEQETQMKEFLGIYPPGDDLDTWLAKRDLAGLDQWKNYWADIWVDFGRNDMFAFIAQKYIEYKEKLLAPPEEVPIEERLPPEIISVWRSLVDNVKAANWLEAAKNLILLPFATMFPEDSEVIMGTVPIGPASSAVSAETLAKLAPRITTFRKMLNILQNLKLAAIRNPLIAIFAATEIPQLFVMGVFAINQIREWQGKDPTSVSIDLNKLSGSFESLGYNFRDAVEVGDVERAKEIIVSMREIANEHKNQIAAKEGVLKDAGTYDVHKIISDTMFDTLLELEKKIVELEAMLPTGTLIIRPTPSDAKVSVEGQYSTTGTWSGDLPVGFYDWTVSKYQYVSESGTIDLTEAGLEFSVELEKEEVIPPTLKAKLIISVVPSDAVITVAGHPEINAPGTYEVDPGNYTIEFTKEGYDDKQTTVFIDEGKTETVSMILKEIPPVVPPEEIKGPITITTIPADVVIEIAGEPDIVEPGTYSLITGSYTVKASKEGFVSQSKTALVLEDKHAVVSFILEEVEPPEDLPTPATIIITSEPTNSDIYIDGKYAFTKTPFTTILEAGTYIIRIQTDGYYPQEATVTFGEGDEIIVPFLLQKIPPEVEPAVSYTPYEPWFPDYQPTTYYTPAVQPTPYSQISVPDYSLIAAPTFTPVIEPVFPGVTEKEIMINIETTDVKPWLGKIFSIAWLDLTTPGAEAQVIVDEDEKGILEAFMNEFNVGNYKTILGYNLKFDYQWIFNKLMLYRIPANKFYETDMRDVFQLMSQIKEAFVYNARAYGTLDEYAKELLGIGKMGTQETLMRRYIAGDIDYVEQFQLRQIEITNGLYQLFRYCSSESFISPILSSPEEIPQYNIEMSPGSPVQIGQKQCANCLAFNPATAIQCEVCGSVGFR